MTTTSIRIATPDDLATVAALFDAYRQFYAQPSDLGLAARFIGERMRNGESVIFLAEDERRTALGFCQLYPTFCSVAAAPVFVLYDLFVTPAARRSGAGRALMLAAEKHARDCGAARLDLSTAKTNLPAQALYESLGWVRDESFYVYNRRL